MLYACSRFGSTVTWYWRTKPPSGATSATPGTDLQVIAEVPVLDRAQFGQVVLAARIHERILKDPADAGRIRPEFGLDPLRQPREYARQVLERARARPIDVGAFVEDDVDVRVAEVGEAADRLHLAAPRAWR